MREPLFVPAPFFLLRSPRWTIEDWEQILKQKEWVDGIYHLYETDELLREAIAIASPSLYAALQKKNVQRTEAIGISLLNYALRMATRAIPFGLFSFVATGFWGQKTEISFDLNKLCKRARPDMSWVYAFIQKLYQEEKSFFSLTVRTNPLSGSNHERFFLSYIYPTEKEDKAPTQTVSIRATPLVQTILALAKEPKVAGSLCDDLLVSISGLDREKVQGVIRELFSKQFLLPAISPSLLSFSPFEDLLSSVPSSVEIDQITQKIEAYNQLPLGRGASRLEELQKNMEAVAPAKTFLQIDAVYRGRPLSLSQSVYEELTSSASVLWKISGRRSLSPSHLAYHAKFMEKYGLHRTVPLLELLSEESGLGSFENHLPSTPPKQTSLFTKRWEKWLYQKWQECLRNKNHELVIDERTIDHLFTLANERPHPPEDALLSLDLFCKIMTESPEQLDQGNFRLLITQSTWQGGSSIGRFIDLFDEGTLAQFRGFLEAEEHLEKGSHFVEVSYRPPTGHNANVAISPCFRKYRLDTEAKKRDATSLSLEDIYVGATHDRFYLTLKDGECEVITRVGNLLNPTFAPLPLKFMREVTLSKYQLLHPFSWDSMKQDAVFLPRVRFGRTVLSPAQWNLDANLFHKERPEKIALQFTSWAEQWNLSKRCFLVRGDQRLLIDRQHPAHLHEISLKLKKGESLQFIEDIENPWIKSEQGHHLCEFVVPFLKNPAYSHKKSIVPSPYLPVSIENRLKLLGSEWIFVKFYLDDGGATRFLIHQLSSLAEKLCREMNVAGWFFIRYRDPERHLRLRIRLSNSESLSEIIFMLNDLSLQWVKAGLIKEMVFGNYEREVERYGGPGCTEAAEFIFCADSISTVHLLRAFSNKTLSVAEPVLQALSVINFLRGFHLDPSQMCNLLNMENRAELKGFREHKNQLIELVQAMQEGSSLKEIEPFTEAFNLREGAQKFFQSQAGNLAPDALSSVYNSMLHMHCNRLGCDTAAEQRARLYAHQALLQLERRSLLKI